MKAEVYNLKNETVGEIELPAGIFGVKWRSSLVHQVLRAQLANLRRPWAHAKGRSEVRGGGRKPWRQKGTGRARHGSIRSPLWRGGGKAHGPSKERDYSQKINKKMRREATLSVLSKKMKNKEIKIFANFEIEAPKTKILNSVLKKLLPSKTKKFNLLIVADRENKNIAQAAANLVKTKSMNLSSLNVYDLLNYKNLFIDQVSAKELAKIYGTK